MVDADVPADWRGSLQRFVGTNIRFEPLPGEPLPVANVQYPMPEGFKLDLLWPHLEPNQRSMLVNYGALPVVGSMGIWLLNIHGWCIDPSGRARCIHLGVGVPLDQRRGLLRFAALGAERPDDKMLALKLAIESDDLYVNSLAG